MQIPLILVIDDSPTIRKMVECHLSQAGYRVEAAPDAERGREMAATLRPDLILLDHQLPGTTGVEVCRHLLESDLTASIPVLVSSAMRNRAFALYADFPNVIDQMPKPFTPELLKSGVANALQTGSQVVKAQMTGCAMPEAVGEPADATLEGKTSAFPLRAVFDFLTNSQVDGRLTVEQGNDRIRFDLAGGRFQAVYSPTVAPETIAEHLPADLADLRPLLAVTLGEHQDASMSGLVKLLERSLSDPKRLRALLRLQASVLTYKALTGEPAVFAFESGGTLPPMFQAFPLQMSLPALAVEGVKHCVPESVLAALVPMHFARRSSRGGNVDRSGLNAAEIRAHTLLDGACPLRAVAAKAGLSPGEVAAVALGLEIAGQSERKNPMTGEAILLLEDDPETARLVLKSLGPEGDGFQVRHVRDRVAAQLLLRRNTFSLVMLPADNPDQEAFYHSLRDQAPATTRFVGVVHIEEESQLDRLDALGLDGVVHRPVAESDLRSTVCQLLRAGVTAGVG